MIIKPGDLFSWPINRGLHPHPYNGYRFLIVLTVTKDHISWLQAAPLSINHDGGVDEQSLRGFMSNVMSLGRKRVGRWR